MRRGGLFPVAFALGLLTAAPALAQDACPPIDQVIADIIKTEPRARADVTERLQCHFPSGTTFNEAAIRLDGERFEMLNKSERMFHRWRERGDEFVTRRWLDAGANVAEIRIVIHVEGGKLTRFAAQYFAHPK